MNVELYRRAQINNCNAITLYRRLGLPFESFYVLFDAVRRRNIELQTDEDYLILLVSLWCPIRHLFPSFAGPFYSFLASEEWQVGFKILAPKLYDRITKSAQVAAQFYCHSSESSLNFYLRLSGYKKLLLNQQRLGMDFEKWRKIYEEHRPHMRQETKHLTASEDCNSIEEGVRVGCLHIFKEYVENLMVDSKNRTKYKPVSDRISRYIQSIECETGNESDDIIGTIFERLLINATQYEPLALIGPAYICWIFEKRINKIGNPPDRKDCKVCKDCRPCKECKKHKNYKTCKDCAEREDCNTCRNCTERKDSNVNILMTTTGKEELFPLNLTVHSMPTVADEAQIYMFDELCALWKEYNLGRTELSKYIFERITPYYRDFMKANLSHPHIKHEYVQYPVAIFTNDFLQRALVNISSNLYVSHQGFIDETQITAKDWRSYFDKEEKEELPFLKKIFIRYSTIIDEPDLWGKRLFRFNFIELLPVIYKAATRESFLEKFKKLYYFPSSKLDYNTSPDKWNQQANELLMDFISNLDFPWKDDVRIVLDKSEDLRHAIYCAVILVCFKVILRSYEKEILVFSKEALFRKYSEEQYNKLFSFCGEPLFESDTAKISELP